MHLRPQQTECSPFASATSCLQISQARDNSPRSFHRRRSQVCSSLQMWIYWISKDYADCIGQQICWHCQNWWLFPFKSSTPLLFPCTRRGLGWGGVTGGIILRHLHRVEIAIQREAAMCPCFDWGRVESSVVFACWQAASAILFSSLQFK